MNLSAFLILNSAEKVESSAPERAVVVRCASRVRLSVADGDAGRQTVSHSRQFSCFHISY